MNRVTLNEMTHLSTGKRARLHRLLYKYGPANGTLLLLPIDQGLEHGPRDFFVNEPAADPEFELRLAKEGKFSGIVFQIGIAEKYMRDYAGEVPLVLKLNGKTEIPGDAHSFSPALASVEDAVRLGADAIGYTIYVGSPAQPEDFSQFAGIREECERFGMPIIVWAYPRGEAIDAKAGKESFWAIDYAARVAAELGADIVKVNMPVFPAEADKLAPSPYNDPAKLAKAGINTEDDAFAHVVKSAGRTMVLVSGGGKVTDEEMFHKAEVSMKSGATGLIFGRNMWQRPFDDAVAMARRISEMMSRYSA